MKRALLFCLAAMSLTAHSQPHAAFSAEEAASIYYKQGFDTREEADTWTYTTTDAAHTWQLLEQPTVAGLKPFSSIDSSSKQSLAITYDEDNAQDETATSPELEIKPGTTCEFYSCFSGGFLIFARWTVFVTDVESGSKKELLDAFKWANENAFTGPNWVKFALDLSDYAGKKVKISINYKGKGGEDALFDGFCLKQKDTSDDATITVNEGQQVHFVDQSTDAVTWQWTFPGGTPVESTEQNPVVTYAKAGVYDVTLVAGDGSATSTAVRKGFVHVVGVAPKAIIGVPQEGYLSPWVACFVPTNKAVTFTDRSTGNPTSWKWQFKGADKESSTDQNPVVLYPKKGLYSLSLQVQNESGIDNDALVDAIQAGGAQYVWNIRPEDNDKLEAINLGWYGYYAGTNWLGMARFAELYKAPLAPAVIDSVAVYFDRTSTVSPDAPITLTINAVGSDGMPATELASTTLKASQLVSDENEIKATVFRFDKPVQVSDKYFVTIGGFPNNTDEATNETDDIAVLCLRLEQGSESTAYHYLEDQDETGQGLGTYKWFKNTDDPVSMAMAPCVNYDFSTQGISSMTAETPRGELSFNGQQLHLSSAATLLTVCTLDGSIVKSVENPSSTVSISAIPKGIYLAKAHIGTHVATLKVVKQ